MDDLHKHSNSQTKVDEIVIHGSKNGSDKTGIAVFRQSNRITMASQRLELVERRIIMSAISKIRKDEEPTDQRIYYVDTSDLVKLGSYPSNSTRDLRTAADTLFNRYVLLKTAEGKIIKIRWIQRVEYDEGNGRIGLRFSHDILPFLTNLRSEYTQFDLLDIQGMTSEYAIRIYTMLMQYKSVMLKNARAGKNFTWVIAIDELRERLMLGAKLQANAVFKLYVLDKSREQINDSPNSKVHILSVQMTKPNGGRKFTHVEFVCQLRTWDDYDMLEEDAVLELPSPDSAQERVYFSFAREINLDQARLTEDQICMFADWLAGLNKKKNEECHYSCDSFLSWLIKQNMAVVDDFGLTEKDLVDYLRNQLSQPDFVRTIYPAWLRKLGFIPKKV